MAIKPRDPKFLGTIGYSMEPVAGVTLYQDRRVTEPSLEEMIEELGKSDIREKRKEELLAKLDERISRIRGTKEERAAEKVLNPKRYLVDPGTGKIDVVDEEGEYTYKDALLVSSSIRAKGGHYEDAVGLINAAKALTEGTKTSVEDKKKEFYVDDDGIIHHDPENGELTLSEARAVSQSKRTPASPPSNTFVDSEGKVHQIAPGQPIIIEKAGQPGTSYMLNQRGELEEIKPGMPIVVRVESKSERPSTPIQLKDKDGNPMVLDIESLISFKKYESEDRRAEESHKNTMEMAGAFKDFLGKIANAAQRMASR